MNAKQLLMLLTFFLAVHAAVQKPSKTLQQFTSTAKMPESEADHCLRLILQTHPELREYEVKSRKKIQSKEANVVYFQVILSSERKEVESVAGFSTNSDSFFVSFDVIKDKKMRISHKRVPFMLPDTLDHIPIPPLFRLKHRFVTAAKLRE